MPQCAPADVSGTAHLPHATAPIGDWISDGPGFVLGGKGIRATRLYLLKPKTRRSWTYTF